MSLNKTALGLALGVLCAGALLLVTVWSTYFGGGEHLEMLKRFYIGYSVSLGGALLGAVYGFIDGFLGGWILAWLYNRFAARAA